ncbi:hypothetical protein [Ferruginibacter sp.]
MKVCLSILIFSVTLTSCQTRLKITSTKIHKNSRFDGSFSIYKIKVDSFSAKGLPARFQIDAVYYCESKDALNNNTNPDNTQKTKYKKTIRVLQPNKYYSWYKWKYNERNAKQRITQIQFEPLQWYLLSLDWKYGFLTDGRRANYFYFDQKGKLTLLFEDHVNDGAF